MVRVAVAQKTHTHQLGVEIAVSDDGNQSLEEWALVERNSSNKLQDESEVVGLALIKVLEKRWTRIKITVKGKQLFSLIQRGAAKDIKVLLNCFTFRSPLVEVVAIMKNKVLSPTERLVGFAILHQAYSSQQTSFNPLISVLLDAASNEEAEIFERGFILQLLGSTSSTNTAEFLKLSAADYIRNFDPSSHTFPPREQLQQQYCSEVGPELVGSLFRNRVMNILPDPDVPQGCDINSTEFDLQAGVTPKIGSGARDGTVSGLLQNLSLQGLGPQWVRPHPPRLPLLERELVWLNPDNTHELMWDGGMCTGSTVEHLIAKSLEGPLEPAEEEQVLLGLGDEPGRKLPEEILPVLVKNNPNLAAEVLIKLRDSTKILKYFSFLFSMDMDFNLIEVVNKLNKAVELQPDLAKMWIVLCSINWDTRLPKDGNPRKAFHLLFKLAEFPRMKEKLTGRVKLDLIDRLLVHFTPTPEFIQHFIKCCIPSEPMNTSHQASLVLYFLKALIAKDIIKGGGSFFQASFMRVVAGFMWSRKPEGLMSGTS
ncbi:uncharacterized protein LOC113777245 [Coffea eugenioides]|uniref:uncharacterized protein LOC113777245 n=1 Tax=Coffea eugenioides TaxID=49369 RepID=UPI000F60D102|nr:uncharacterized protein LOC113777245 [Coffea eugenioides]